MDTYPCLVCGEDFDYCGISSKVKNEVVSDFEIDFADTSSIIEEGSHHHQIGGNGSEGEWSKDEKESLQLFFEWFNVPVKKKGSQRRNAVDLEGWDGSSAEDPFPFCTACKKPLMEALELKRLVVEMEKDIKRLTTIICNKATSSEQVFDSKQVYLRDVRYLGVRQRIVADFKTRYEGQFFEKKKKTTTKSRTSLRLCTATLEDTIPVPDYSFNSPTCSSVLLSRSNQTMDDQYLSGTEVTKIEEPEDDWSADFHLDDVGANSDVDPDSAINIIFNDQESNNLMYDDEFTLSGKRRSTRKRKVVNFKEDELAELSDNDELGSGFQSAGDSDFDLESAIALTSSKSTKKKKKRKVLIQVEEDDDLDFTLNEEEALTSCDDDLDAYLVKDFGPAEKKYKRVKFDHEKKTATYDNLVFSMQSSSAEKKYKCLECNKELNSIRNHYLKSHSDLYACRHCGYRATSRGKLSTHISAAHEKILPSGCHSCPICEKPLLVSKNRRLVHVWSHKNAEEKREALARGGEDVPDFQRKLQCDICGFPFSNLPKLRTHKKLMHGDAKNGTLFPKEPKQCLECGEAFFSLRAHQRAVHGTHMESQKCTEPGCGKVFSTHKGLDKHVKAVHLKIRPFKCTMCPREFGHKHTLDKHTNLHLGIRPWQCEHCPMTFTQLGHLKKHSNTYHVEGRIPRRKPFIRGPTMLPRDVRKGNLVREGKYLPPSALATWAAGREPTSHFPVTDNESTNPLPSSSQQADPPRKLTPAFVVFGF